MPGLYNRFDNKQIEAPYDYYYSATSLTDAPPPAPLNLGIPVWVFHPLEAAKCWLNFVITEVEDYSVLPVSLVAGGLIIYYLRKTPTL